MFRSTGLRFLAVGFLVLLMSIPLGLVSEVVQERARYSEQTVRDISREWGGAQLISGPVLVVPVTEDVTRTERRMSTDPVTGQSRRDDNGRLIYELIEETETEARAPVYLYPEVLDVSVDMTSQTRKRGVFDVPVFAAEADIGFAFDTGRIEEVLAEGEEVDWTAAEVRVHLTSNRGLRGEARLEAGEVALPLDPIAGGQGGTGVAAATGDPRGIDDYRLTLGVNGAQSFGLVATGRLTRFDLTSDWPDPSFAGTFLPDASTIDEAGFLASWTVPHLARSLPAVSRENLDGMARKGATMEARFLTPNDFYQKAWRASRYGLLFVSLTFLTLLLIERGRATPIHAVQYLMVGVAQAIFALLMVSYAEQIGFGFAYALAAGATIGLITLYGMTGLKLGPSAWTLGGVLTLVYGVLFLVLRSTDYALLAGSTLAFLALGGTMFATRNEAWHGGDGGGWRLPRLRRTPQQAEA